jgi:hypothetical protein
MDLLRTPVWLSIGHITSSIVSIGHITDIHVCSRSYRDNAGFVLGIASLCFWLVAQVSQL